MDTNYKNPEAQKVYEQAQKYKEYANNSFDEETRRIWNVASENLEYESYKIENKKISELEKILKKFLETIFPFRKQNQLTL